MLLTFFLICAGNNFIPITTANGQTIYCCAMQQSAESLHLLTQQHLKKKTYDKCHEPIPNSNYHIIGKDLSLSPKYLGYIVEGEGERIRITFPNIQKNLYHSLLTQVQKYKAAQAMKRVPSVISIYSETLSEMPLSPQSNDQSTDSGWEKISLPTGSHEQDYFDEFEEASSNASSATEHTPAPLSDPEECNEAPANRSPEMNQVHV